MQSFRYWTQKIKVFGNRLNCALRAEFHICEWSTGLLLIFLRISPKWPSLKNVSLALFEWFSPLHFWFQSILWTVALDLDLPRCHHLFTVLWDPGCTLALFWHHQLGSVSCGYFSSILTLNIFLHYTLDHSWIGSASQRKQNNWRVYFLNEVWE